MDCNKDEAIRAKQVAEKKMERNDFEGARKVALKAQNLFPDLENIKQLLSVCDVHCSAQKTLSGLEKDWYGILHVDRFADDSTVKKQYRRLALYLHPDKNQFPGAEAAFKVICEAYAVLSDPVKKSLYDTKLSGTVTVKSAPVRPAPHHSNKNSQGSMQFTPVFSSSASYHPAAQTNNMRVGIFCTMCPFCSLKHQSDRKFLNTTMRCQKCFKNFLGYEIFSESACSVPKSCGTQVPVGQSAGFQEKGGPKCQFSTDDVQNMASSVNAPRGGRRTGKFCGDANESKKKDLKKKSRKGSKRYVVESSDSFISSSESDVEFVNHSGDPVFVPSDAPRRSTRKRTNISYHEDDNDDDFHVATKKSQESKMSPAEAGPCKQKDRPITGESVPNTENAGPTNAECSWKQNNETGSTILGESSEEEIGDHDEENDSYECPDPEFSDFDKARDENCFAVNQFWACYGGNDGMPRFYAKVKEVSVSPFELSFTWLESDPTNENHGKLIDNPFPVGCGWFKHGRTEQTSRRLMFSHQVHFVRGKKRGSLLLRPRQSEIWALFKESDLNSSSNHEYVYEIVEVLSEFTEDSGIRVCYLNKVVGFVSLFQSSRHNEADSFLISPTELYRFSHGIPFFKMTGSERDGVPAGSFELDPASLPTNPNNILCNPGKDKGN